MSPDTLTRVAALLAEVCAVDASAIKPEVRLRAYGLDSVRAFEMIILIEDAFRLKVPPEALDELKNATVADLADFVGRLR
jgi:acyl carrier protein